MTSRRPFWAPFCRPAACRRPALSFLPAAPLPAAVLVAACLPAVGVLAGTPLSPSSPVPLPSVCHAGPTLGYLHPCFQLFCLHRCSRWAPWPGRGTTSVGTPEYGAAVASAHKGH